MDHINGENHQYLSFKYANLTEPETNFHSLFEMASMLLHNHENKAA